MAFPALGGEEMAYFAVGLGVTRALRWRINPQAELAGTVALLGGCGFAGACGPWAGGLRAIFV